MCGIVGIVHHDGAPVDPAVLRRMRDAIVHRGPDDAGEWFDDGVALGHRRLSIFDLSPLGHQPMLSPDESAALVFNGEVFNFLEIRQPMEAAGERFRSQSDTEVLLRSFQRRGVSCLDDLIGMFGFAIWDRGRRRLFAARDRAGIKPFYYVEFDGGMAFASEIKALLAHPKVTARLDAQGFADQMFAGYALKDRTLFAGIRQLPPGHLMEVENGRIRTRPYWSVRFAYNTTRSAADTTAELADLLEDAVRLHVRSDAPLGSHLSGGIDSSTVATLARRYHDPLDTFSIRFAAGGPFDESAYAREVAAHIGSRHHEETPPDIEAQSLLPFLLWHMEFPMRPGGFAYFAGARLARRHVTVSLTGHGGDEVFGGYPAQFQTAFGGGGIPNAAEAVAQRPSASARLGALLRQEGWRGVLDRVTRRLRPQEATAADRWIALHCSRPEPSLDPKLDPAIRRALAGYSPRQDFLHGFDDAPTDDLFDRCLHHDLRSYLPSLLHVEDRASMAVSLESRVPLLDHRLIEFMATVPSSQKVPTKASKELLRQVVQHRLPERVMARRDKGAFPVPVDAWLNGPFRPFALSILRDERTLSRGVFTPEWLRATALEPSSESLWTALSVELWARLFFDGDQSLRGEVQRVAESLRPAAALAP